MRFFTARASGATLKFVVRARPAGRPVGLGTHTAQAAAFLDAAVLADLNVLVSGGTQTGKTTLLK